MGKIFILNLLIFFNKYIVNMLVVEIMFPGCYSENYKKTHFIFIIFSPFARHEALCTI